VQAWGTSEHDVQVKEEIKRATETFGVGRHFLSHGVPTVPEVQGMIDAVLPLYARFGGDLTAMAALAAIEPADNAVISLPAPVFARFVGARCLNVFEAEMGAAIRAPEWKAIADQFAKDKTFHDVRST
jgi:hypothetical protein